MQQVAVDNQRVPPMRTEQKADALIDVIENLTMTDPAVETKRPSKSERIKTKAERPKGGAPVADVMMLQMRFFSVFICILRQQEQTQEK